MCDARKNSCCQAANSALASYLTFVSDLTGRLPGLVAAAFPDPALAAPRIQLGLAALRILNTAISNALIQVRRGKCQSRNCTQVATAVLNVGISFANAILATITNPAIPLDATPGVESLSEVLTLFIGSGLVAGRLQVAIASVLRGNNDRGNRWRSNKDYQKCEKECEEESEEQCEKPHPCERPLRVKPIRRYEEECEKPRPCEQPLRMKPNCEQQWEDCRKPRPCEQLLRMKPNCEEQWEECRKLHPCEQPLRMKPNCEQQCEEECKKNRPCERPLRVKPNRRCEEKEKKRYDCRSRQCKKNY